MATGIWHPWSMATAQDQGIPIKRERQNYGKLVQILTVGSCVPALWVQVLGCAEGSREECGRADALITTYCCPGCCSPPLLWKENKFVFILSLRCACRPLLSMLFSTVPPEPEQRLVLCRPEQAFLQGQGHPSAQCHRRGRAETASRAVGNLAAAASPAHRLHPSSSSKSGAMQQLGRWLCKDGTREEEVTAGTLGGAVLSLCLFRLQLLSLVFYPMSSVHSEVPAAGQPRALRPPSQHTALTDGGSLMCMGRWCQAVAGECWGSSHTRAAALKGV